MLEAKIREMLEKYADSECNAWEKDGIGKFSIDQATSAILKAVNECVPDELDLAKIADKALGYEGIGTCMTPGQIHKVFGAIVAQFKANLSED